MTALMAWFGSYDGLIIITGVLCAVAAALPGTFLVLRRMSLLGDAISHAVLPGLAIAFFLTESRASVPMFVGAVLVGLLTAVLTEWIRDFGSVDEGASMGVVFTTLFALGLVMIVQAADHVDLDPGCVLYGSIESTPLETVAVGGYEIPRAILMLGSVAILNGLFVVVFFKELLISAFDPGMATTAGYSARLMHYLLMVIVAVTAVASFETAGNILVVAMFVVPPSTAYLLTTRLSRMILLSLVIAAGSAILGHWSAKAVPGWFGFGSTSIAGMMALCAGLLFLLAALFSPLNGVVVRFYRRMKLARRILAEDVIALLYRLDERQPGQSVPLTEICTRLLSNRIATQWAVTRKVHKGLIELTTGGYRLTESGHRAAAELVRSHRLWEHYLVSEGISPDVIHRQAEKLEHYTDRELRDRLQVESAAPALDPHGSPIPEERRD